MRGYQLRHLGNIKLKKNYLFAGAAFASSAIDCVAGVWINAPLVFVSAVLALAFAFGASVTTGASAGIVAGASSALPDNTDPVPLSAGIEISNADTMKTAAAAIVIRESTEAEPRGANAELETLLVNKAPASVLPGCSKTDPIRAMQAPKNNAYKM